jgi:L-2-hydroxyglutarate oxidase
MKTEVDVTVIGAGVVGLATAFQLKRRHPRLKILVVDKETGPSRHQSGRNSGVIHSGLYYSPGSLKATLCVSGRRQLIDYASRRGVAYDICGKVVVAVDETERARLEKLWDRGLKNGLDGLRWLDAKELALREPHIRGVAAILVPEEGIIDYKGMARSLVKELEEQDVRFLFGAEVKRFTEEASGLCVRTSAGDVASRAAMVCGGLQSDRLLAMTGTRPLATIIPFRGEYFNLTPAARSLVKHLVYPVPDPAFPFLGVHFTRMTTGDVECGPNAVLAFAREGYSKFAFSPRDAAQTLTHRGFLKFAAKHFFQGMKEQHRSLSKAAFVEALQRMLPEIRAEHLTPGGCGVRAQAMDDSGKLVDDFLFHETERCLFVLNAPSPAATASFAIGDSIVNRFEERIFQKGD